MIDETKIMQLADGTLPQEEHKEVKKAIEADPTLKELYNSYQETGSVVVAKRKNRSESFLFKLFYLLYKALFKLLTGKSIHFGNFSIFSSSVVNKLILSQNIWNNFPATLLSLKLPIFSIDTDRGERYFSCF